MVDIELTRQRCDDSAWIVDLFPLSRQLSHAFSSIPIAVLVKVDSAVAVVVACHLSLAFASSHEAVWAEMGLVLVLGVVFCSSSLISIGKS